MGDTPSVLIAHPSPDLYGSDLQLLETIVGLRQGGYRVTVALPVTGPLQPKLAAAGADVVICSFPVLRRSVLSLRGGVKYLLENVAAMVRLCKLIRKISPHVVFVNTITIPTWIAAARVGGRAVVCHVHEAEDGVPRIVGSLLISPLLLVKVIIVNSDASGKALRHMVSRLDSKIEKIYNGVERPSADVSGAARLPLSDRDPVQVLCVGRLSPRKGTDVALDAVAEVRARGVDASLVLYGDCYPGYEWFVDDLRSRASRADLAGRIRFMGYVDSSEIEWDRSQIALVPSRLEPFGNTAVEAQLEGLPVIASRTQGLVEIVADGTTGLLALPGDSSDLARCILTLVDNPDEAAALAARGRASATNRFGTETYRTNVVRAVERARRAGVMGSSSHREVRL